MTVWSQPLSVLRKRRILQKICAVLVLVVIITTTLFVISQRNASAAPSTVSFTARLKNADGSIVADGFYNIGFKLYGQVSGGSAIWSENYFDENGPTAGQDYRVKVINGYFSVKLGSRTSFDSNVNWDSNLWLTMNIGGTTQNGDVGSISWDGEMSPRVELTATPYSINSGAVGGKTANDLIHNSTDLQNADFNISGTGTASTLQATTGVITPSIDRADAGTLTIGGANATSISLADDVAVAAGKSLTLAGGATETRPSSPTEGMMYFDTTTKQLLVYSNGKWQSDSKTATQIVAASNSSQAAKDGANFVADNEASIGTGTIDGDQIQINAAIAALPASGGSVYLTEGVYYLDASVVIPSNVQLRGTGTSSVITVNNNLGSGIALITNSDPVNGNTNISIRDLVLHGNRDNNASVNAMRGIEFTRAGSGAGATATTGATISENTLTHFRGNAIYMTNSHNSDVSHNKFLYSADNGVSIESGANNSIVNNSFNGVTMAIRFATATYSTISNNNINGSSSINGAIDMRTGSSNNTVTDNSIKNSTQISLRIATSSNNLINNNLFTDNGGSGAYNVITIAGSADDNTLSRNTFRDTIGTGHAISIDSASADRTYIDGNSLGGPGASTINDLGTNTIYSGQQDSSGNYVVKTAGSGSIQLVGGTQISGTLSATAIQSSTFDSSSTGPLTIGGSNANSVTIGRTGSTTTVEGQLRAQGLDTNTASILQIGTTSATSINLGQNTALAADKTLAVNGETTIKSGTINSANALRVQDSGGTNLFTVDTANNRVAIGTSDTTGVLLVLDTKTSAGDPTGTNGAMYYNSSSSKFRCYENGAWKDCVTPLPVSVTAQTTTTTDQTTPVDVTNMTFALAANTKYYYKFVIQHESDETTTGSGFGITAPSGVTMSNWCINTTAITNVASPGLGSYCGTGDASATTTGADNPGNYFTSNIEGYIQTGGTAGELKLRFKSETTGKEVTIDPKSFGILQIVQ